jgi:hypothetical protein
MNESKKIKVETNGYEYTYTPIYIENEYLSPLLEFKRYQLLRKFSKDLQSFFFETFQWKIHYWDCFSMIRHYIFDNLREQTHIQHKKDPLFPFHGKPVKNLEESFFFILQKNHISTSSKKDYEKFIQLFSFSTYCDKMIEELEIFKESEVFLQNYQNYQFIVNEMGEMKLITIQYPFDEKIHGIFDIFKMTFKIHPILLKKIRNQYQLYTSQNQIPFEEKTFENLLACLFIRYETIHAGNEQLACNPEFYHEMKRELGFDFEMFGSAINTQYHQFGSLFYDIEKYFLSRGSFYGIECKRGKYVANPPFVNDVIQAMALKMIRNLDETKNKKPLSFFITIPGWESNEEYGEYTGFETMKKSKYMTYFKEIPQNLARFFDYANNRIIYPCKIFFLLIENEKAKEEYHMKDIIEKNIQKYFHAHDGKESNYSPQILNMVGGYIDRHHMNMIIYDSTKKINMESEKRMKKLKVIKECFQYEKKEKIKKDIQFTQDGYDYQTKEAKSYYKKWSMIQFLKHQYPPFTKFYLKKIEKLKSIEYKKGIPEKRKNIYHVLQNNVFYAFKTQFKEIEKIDKLCFIDISISETGSNEWIVKRLNEYYEEMMKHFLEKETFITTDCKILYRSQDLQQKNKNSFIHLLDESFMKTKNQEYDFVIMTGSLRLNELVGISYFYEQINVFNFFLQLVLLINHQKKGGSFMLYFYTSDIKPYQQILSFLHSYYHEICIQKIFPGKYGSDNAHYICGKSFKGISHSELNKLYSIYQTCIEYYKDDIGENLNIFDVKKRKKFNIYKYFYRHHHNQFISSLFDIKTSPLFLKKLKKLNQNIFKELIKRIQKSWVPMKKTCSMYNILDFTK